MEPAPTNKGNKKSLFMCFRPAAYVVDDAACRASKRRTDPVLEYLTVADEDGIVSFSAPARDGGEEWGSRHRRKNARDKWRAFRTAFNDTTMMKKITSSRRKSNKGTSSSSTSRSSSRSTTLEGGEASIKIPNPQPNKIIMSSRNTSNASSTISSTGTSSSSSSAFTPSSMSSSCSSRSTTTDQVSASSSRELCSPTPPLNNGSAGFEDMRKGYCSGGCSNNTVVLCMFLVSLLVLILWGKFLAIFCTSILFYLVRPSRRSCDDNEGVLCVDQSNNEFDSVEYKKKIIMEGFLDRSPSRVSLATSAMPKLL